MKIVIDRCTVTKNWIGHFGSIDSGETFFIGHAGRDAREAVIFAQAAHPEAEVGVRSRCFGRVTMTAFGPVVWMRPNLSRKG